MAGNTIYTALEKLSLQVDETNRKVDGMTRQNSEPKQSSNHGDLGSHVKTWLTANKKYINYIPSDGAGFFSEEQQHAAMASMSGNNHEKHLVGFVTPFFQNMAAEIDANLAFVNSEYYSWMKSLSGESCHDTKPDGFLIDKSLVKYRGLYKGAVAEKCLFGQLADWSTRGSLRLIIDAKKKMSPTGYGDVLTYLKRLGDGTDMWYKGIVYDPTEFRLITSQGDQITSTTEGKWTDGGSYNLIKCFIQELNADHWSMCLHALCGHLNVEIVVPSADDVIDSNAFWGTPYLGAGAHGRVFKVKRMEGGNAGNYVALKVVLVIESDELAVERCISDVEKEFTLLAEAKSICSDNIVPVMSFHRGKVGCGSISYAGYLMTIVGTPIERNKDNYIRILKSLGTLHANSITHGDARIQNVVEYMEKIYWIDFRESKLGVGAMINAQYDIVTFLQSIGIETNFPVLLGIYKESRNINDVVNYLDEHQLM